MTINYEAENEITIDDTRLSEVQGRLELWTGELVCLMSVHLLARALSFSYIFHSVTVKGPAMVYEDGPVNEGRGNGNI